jgi:hypothetical protein
MEATDTNCIVLGLTRPGFEQANEYITDAVQQFL